jgi:2-alkyl-3-oxoalkanoate reductase
MTANNGSTLRVLVTGATGFLGGNILNALAHEQGVEIVAACRTTAKLPKNFQGEVRVGDLLDAQYRKALVKNIDVVCHAGTWSSFWGHKKKEQTHFYEPCIDLIEQSIAAGVEKFLLASTVAIAKPNASGSPIDDFSETAYTGFWPHLDKLIDVDNYMKANANRGTTLVNMRLGHFVGKGNSVGLVAALVPRLRTYMVPILGWGKARMAMVSDHDLAQGFVKAAKADGLKSYESFNICGSTFPTVKEVFHYIAEQTNSPKPFYHVPYFAGFAFGALMELIAPIMPKGSPFLTRSLVHVGKDWFSSSEYAFKKIGYKPQKDWKTAVDEAINELDKQGFPWPRLVQS